jgi:hypothetical protein
MAAGLVSAVARPSANFAKIPPPDKFRKRINFDARRGHQKPDDPQVELSWQFLTNLADLRPWVGFEIFFGIGHRELIASRGA